MEYMHFEQTFYELCNNRLSYDQIDQIDKELTMLLNTARKKVVGLIRNIVYSYKKEHLRSIMLY